jgi:hypothetical protein
MTGGWLAGEFDPWPTREEMARVLAAGGLRVDVGAYWVRLLDFERFAFEHYDEDLGDPVVVGNAGDVTALVEAAKRISAVLAASDIVHRLEVHRDDDGDLVAYLHHRWNRFELDGDGADEADL